MAASSPAKGKVTVTWDAPTSDGGSAVLGYDVAIDDRSGQSTCASSFSSSATQKVLSNTASFTSVPGTKYCLRVRAINAAGNGDVGAVRPRERDRPDEAQRATALWTRPRPPAERSR